MPIKPITPNDFIIVQKARENNLKNIDINIPKNQLVVITGLSGSGKSSLAFDTIYAEGQRRYLESLSSYARMFLGGIEKPDVDSIEGLSPAVSIDQKSTSHNPRSTVGTVTEIYDYLRILWARIGQPYCPRGHGLIQTQTPKQIVDRLLACDDNARLQLLAPVAINEKGTFKNTFERLRKRGFLRVLVDARVHSLDEDIQLAKNLRHDVYVIVDRIVVHHDTQTRQRLTDAVETALEIGNNILGATINEQPIAMFSRQHACVQCDFVIPELEPRLFSFNSPVGACDYCRGLGFTYEPDAEQLLPDPTKSINEGGIDFFKHTVNTTSLAWQRFYALLKHFHIPQDVPLGQLSAKQRAIILHGANEPIPIKLVSVNNHTYEKFEPGEGVADLVKRLHSETSSEMAREHYSKYMAEKTCHVCGGKKLSARALCVLVGNLNIIAFTQLQISAAIDYLMNLNLNATQAQIAHLALREIVNRLTFLQNVGLDYLTLARSANTLSGGEAQRIRLATQIGAKLTGVLYVLDEPSIGLHQRDNERLLKTLQTMRDLGNTLLVVEHDEETMRAADHLIDMGPGAGRDGGYVVAEGSPESVAHTPASLTGQYLSGKQQIDTPPTRRGGNGHKLVLKGASGNNLKKVDVIFPLNKLIAITGVSGSGKSTLINQTLIPALQKQVFLQPTKPAAYQTLDGSHHIDKLVVVSQDPIGRTPRSNPATYVGVFDAIRDLFASAPEAKARGYLKSRFSFNVAGGRCERCCGDGVIRIEMHFLPDVYVPCEECRGRKYNDATLDIKYRGKSIYDVLQMTVAEATTFFVNIPNIYRQLQLMSDVGLGYLALGTNASQLSGGEAQRIKLAKYLQRRATGKTLYTLDEPTTGLHTHDIKQLLAVLNRIVDNGDTVIVIEHNLDLIQAADYVIDLGPQGGDGGGKVIAAGTPEQIAQNESSATGVYLKRYWAQRHARATGTTTKQDAPTKPRRTKAK